MNRIVGSGLPAAAPDTTPGGRISMPCVSAPSFPLLAKPSTAPSSMPASHSSLWCVRRRSAPWSSAYTSAGVAGSLASAAQWSLAAGASDPTSFRSRVTRAEAPLATSTRETYCSRSSVTSTMIDAPSLVHAGSRTPRSSLSVSSRGTPPSAEITAKRLWS